MQKLLDLKAKTAILLYLLIDLFCVGAGMGVPIFCILFGFPLGWYITGRVTATALLPRAAYIKILKVSSWAAAYTFLLMLMLWGVQIPHIFDPSFDFRNFGHPFILFEPRASFIGWLVLMIVISPFLQLLTTIFSSFVTLTKIEAFEN